VKFYKELFGANRIILPRVLSIQEINEITAENTDMDFEIFIKNEGCTYIDGFCNFVHGVQFIPNGESCTYNPPCELRYQVQCSSEQNPMEPSVLESRLDKVLGMKGNCGICSLYLFNRTRIKSLKIVSRDTDPDSVVMDIKKVKESIQLCEEIDDFMEFKNLVRSGFCKNNYKEKRIFCYYSEVIRDEML
jgi:putative protease